MYKAEQNKPEAAKSELKVQIAPEANVQDQVPDSAVPKAGESAEAVVVLPPVPP